MQAQEAVIQRSFTEVSHVSIKKKKKKHQPCSLSKPNKLMVSQCELCCSGITLSFITSL